ncbi:hypothetical protein, partial [Providencia huaxiensis]|uniref:hypothetical protein n=1 Tax=Providencia huaxiensis TaxID=2027290 RepID=UPI002FE2E0ED
LIFGETIITAPFAVCFLYRKDQHALALALLTVGFTAAANGVNHKMPRQHMGNHHNMVYSVTEQTTTPNETVKKLANSTPKIEDGKRYVVKVTVMEAPEFKAMNTMPTPEPMRTPAANQ